MIKWTWLLFEFFFTRAQASAVLFAIFCMCLIGFMSTLWKKNGFKEAVSRPLKFMGIAFTIYFIYFAILAGKKDYFISLDKESPEIDILLLPLLCGLLAFSFVLLVKKILIYTANNLIVLIGIPLCLFGSAISFILFYSVALNFTREGRHVPLEWAIFILLLLQGFALYSGIKRLIEKAGARSGKE